MKKIGYLCNCKSEINNVCNAVEGHCLQAIKVLHHHANGRFDWLISEHQSVNPSREAIAILSGKYKRFTFVDPVTITTIQDKNTKNIIKSKNYKKSKTLRELEKLSID